ncbi:MAG: asparagine synthase (glutamine-hydrolyzing) [Vicinamibacterales bacterium]
MCGIAGILTRDREARDSRDVIGRMTGAVRHRGPDSGGVWTDDAAGIAFGHRRLAVIDLSEEGQQPMVSADGRYVINFNGEIYNFRALRRELESEPEAQRFRGGSDTEVMLAAISRWGLDAALTRFNGMFAFALWDRQERTLSLARDRMGEKPLYYARTPGSLIFGSELKALRAHPGFVAEIDRNALSLYLRHNYLPAPYSIYRGTYKLPAGCWCTVREGMSDWPAARSYWPHEQVVAQGLADPLRESDDEIVRQLESLLDDAVRLRMEADVPLGAFLSGGIDSSLIVALMQKASGRPVKTFSIGFAEKRYNEAEYASAVAGHLGTDHHELYVTPQEAMAVIPELPAIYDEPFADPSQIPTCLVSRLARQHVTVSLSGDGGDELFAGYDRYFQAARRARQIRRVPLPARRVLAGVMRSIPGGNGRRRRELADLLSVDTDYRLYHWLRAHWKRPDEIVLGGHEYATAMSSRSSPIGGAGFCDQMMYADMEMYLPDNGMVKVDRASMAVSLEARVPLLDHRLVEMAWRVPLRQKIRDGRGKWVLRTLLEKYVPAAMIDRPKRGFTVPIGAWLRGPLAVWADDLLAESRLRNDGFFDAAAVGQKWREHRAGAHDWTYPLWTVLMFQLWLTQQRPSAATQ